MAARIKRLRHDEETRSRIQASQLINRLSDHVDGTIELSATQVNAAKILLNKVIPDLASVELTGDEENPVVTKNIFEWASESKSGE